MRFLRNFYKNTPSIIANGGVIMKKYIIFSLILLGLYTFSACYPIRTLPETDEKQYTAEFNIENNGADGENAPEQSENSDNAGSDGTEEQQTPMTVRIDGVIYTSDGEVSDMARCGVMDGYIDSCVDKNSLPDKDNQSNFGENLGFQYGPDGTIHVLIDGNWVIFRSTQNYDSRADSEICGLPKNETIVFDGRTYEKTSLSASTLEWLENYNSLTHSEQQLIQYIPEDLIF